MRHSARLLLIASAWIVAAPPHALAQEKDKVEPVRHFTINYTGRLFGYFRSPSLQKSSLNACLDEKAFDKKTEQEAATFAEELNKLDTSDKTANVLVGVGDNFAPFLLGRGFWLEYSNQPWQGNRRTQLEAKERYEYDDPAQKASQQWVYGPTVSDTKAQDLANGNGDIPTDNVVCFLQAAHFRAIVPGKHDFYFGPARLREIANKLMQPAPKPDKRYTEVRMLAANLVVGVHLTTPAAKEAPTKAPPAIKVSHPQTVLPWMRSIVVNPSTSNSVYLVRNYKTPTCRPSIQLDNDHAKEPRYVMHKGEPLLEPGCIYDVKETPAAEVADTFEVAEPFFWNKAPGHYTHTPWVTENRDGQTIVIFGVVQQNLGESVGRLNYTWLGTAGKGSLFDDNYESTVDVSVPAQALKQVVEYYEEVTNKDTKAVRLLLAQMPLNDVYQMLPLVKGAKFDVIIAQADQSRASASRRTVTRLDTGVDENKQQWAPTVLVPTTHFDSEHPYTLNVRLQSVTFEDYGTYRAADNGATPGSYLEVDLFRDPELARLKQGPPCTETHDKVTKEVPCILSAIRQRGLLEGIQPASALDADILQKVALRVMQRACKSDMAMLQKRDVFFEQKLDSSTLTGEGIRIALQAIFWKGDSIQCMNLTGDTISSLLKQSDTLAKSEANGEVTDLSYGWSLTTLGVTQTATGWVVNGQYLDPKKLYSVAVTDYLANGDTGYPALKGSEPPPQTALSQLHIRDLAANIAAELDLRVQRGGTERVMFPGDTDITAVGYLDALNREPNYGIMENPNPNAEFHDWVSKVGHLEAYKDTKTTPETMQQWRPTVSIDLYKFDIGYTFFQHNVSETQVGKLFPGVTAVDLSGLDSATLALGYSFRVQRDKKRWSPYFQSDLNYARKMQRSRKDGLYQISQTANYWYFELGEAIRLHPAHQNPSGWKWLLPFGTKTQLAAPYTSLINSNTVPAPRNIYLSFRPGLRLDINLPRFNASASDKILNSYLEFGFQFGRFFHAPSAFVFSNLAPGTGCVATPVDSNLEISLEAVTGCFDSIQNSTTAKLTKVIADRNYNREGFYLNFRFDVPLPWMSKAEFVAENRGEVFPWQQTRDSAVDTLFYDDLKHSLQVPIYGKFSLSPNLEVFMFQNKVLNHLWVSYSTSLTLTYSFQYRPGLGWKKVLGFSNPVPLSAPIPSK